MSLILVIDDDMLIRKVLADVLECNGYTVDTAEDGVAGLARMREHKPQVVVLDLMMDKKNGFEVYAEMKADKELKDIPVLILTALREEDLKPEKKSLLSGISAFITKGTPAFHKNKFLESVAKLVSSNNGGSKTMIVKST